jgi:hypothetical protein
VILQHRRERWKRSLCYGPRLDKKDIAAVSGPTQRRSGGDGWGLRSAGLIGFGQGGTAVSSANSPPGLGSQLAAFDTQVADRVIYLKLVGDLDGFLAEFRASAATASTREHQWVLRLPIRTSSSTRTRSPSATASRSGNPPAAATTT